MILLMVLVLAALIHAVHVLCNLLLMNELARDLWQVSLWVSGYCAYSTGEQQRDI